MVTTTTLLGIVMELVITGRFPILLAARGGFKLSDWRDVYLSGFVREELWLNLNYN